MKIDIIFSIIINEFGGEKMYSISNLERINYPKELVYDLTRLYTYKGRDSHFEDFLKQYMSQIVKNTVENDVIATAKILKLDVNENRLRLIVKKDSEPRTKHEKLLRNLKEVFTLIQKEGEKLNLQSNEFLQLGTWIFKDVSRFGFKSDTVIDTSTILTERKKVSRREKLDEEIKKFIEAKDKLKVEHTQCITSFYVDLLNMKCFDMANEFVSLMTCYCLFFSVGFKVFRYSSFFEFYYKHLDEFKKYESESSYGWEQGYAKTDELDRLFINSMLEGYNKAEKMVRDVEFDKGLRKIDNVEGVIMKLGDTFSREDIKLKVPNLSDSTINRALNKLKAEGKIRPDGTGRSAKWVRLVPDELFTSKTLQYNIFDFIKDKN